MTLNSLGTGAVLAEVRTRSEGAIPVRARPAAPALANPRARRRGLAQFLAAATMVAGALAALAYLTRPPEVVVASLSRGPAVEAVYATGVVEAVDFARVGATLAGRVVSVPVDEGMAVKKGQLIAQLDDREARARLEDARARSKMAEAEVARDDALASRGFLAVQGLERAQEERDQAMAAVDLFARQVEDLAVASPLDGIVMKRDVEPGEQAAPNAVLFEICSPQRKRIAADVDERDIPNVRLGGKLVARADGFRDRAFEARVTNIRLQGDASTRTFRVEADLPADSILPIGMTVDTNIVVAERDDALLAPAGAVQHGLSQGGRPGPAYVFVARDGRARRVDVELGAVGAGKAEILAGLADDDKAIVNPPSGLADGAPVRVSP
jgi:RND family efflux transporter MFP subunit